MNEREQFRQWGIDFMSDHDKSPDLYDAYQAGAESNQAELDKANKEVEYYLSAYRLAHKQAMDNGQARDKANERIAQLEEALKNANEETKLYPGHAGRYYLVLVDSPSTWLSEHDKAVEVRVLEELSISSDPSMLFKMIESRKPK